MSDYLSIPAAAEKLGLKPGAVRMHLFRGRLPYVKLGRRVLIPAAALEKMLAQLQVVTPEEAASKVEAATR